MKNTPVFTPCAIIDHVVRPFPHDAQTGKVIDPCLGTGAFVAVAETAGGQQDEE